MHGKTKAEALAEEHIAARHHYEVNLRAQLEIVRLHKRFDGLLERLEQ